MPTAVNSADIISYVQEHIEPGQNSAWEHPKYLTVDGTFCFLQIQGEKKSRFKLTDLRGNIIEIIVEFKRRSAQLVAVTVNSCLDTRPYVYPVLLEIIMAAINNEYNLVVVKEDLPGISPAVLQVLGQFDSRLDKGYQIIDITKPDTYLLKYLIQAKNAGIHYKRSHNFPDTRPIHSDVLAFGYIHPIDYRILKVGAEDGPFQLLVENNEQRYLSAFIDYSRSRKMTIYLETELPLHPELFAVVLNTLLFPVLINKIEQIAILPDKIGRIPKHYQKALAQYGFRSNEHFTMLAATHSEIKVDFDISPYTYTGSFEHLPDALAHDWLDYLLSICKNRNNQASTIIKVIKLKEDYHHIEKQKHENNLIYRLISRHSQSIGLTLSLSKGSAIVKSFELHPSLNNTALISALFQEAIIAALHQNHERLIIEGLDMSAKMLVQTSLAEFPVSLCDNHLAIDLQSGDNPYINILLTAKETIGISLLEDLNDAMEEGDDNYTPDGYAIEGIISNGKSLYFYLISTKADQSIIYMEVKNESESYFYATVEMIDSQDAIVELTPPSPYDQTTFYSIFDVIILKLLVRGITRIKVIDIDGDSLSNFCIYALERYGFVKTSSRRSAIWELQQYLVEKT